MMIVTVAATAVGVALLLMVARPATTSSPLRTACSRGDVFTRDVLETWIWYKRETELAEIRYRPVPYEFFLYYDI